MKWDQVIMGSLAIIWGIILVFMRREILDLSREGGKGLRDRSVINGLVITAVVFLILGGVFIIIFRGH